MNLFSKIRLKSWQVYWRMRGEDNVGESVIREMRKHKINPYEFSEFYKKHGDDQLEFLEKLITERIKEKGFEGLSKTECAFLGYYELQEFMKQIVAELDYEDKVAEAQSEVKE